LGPWGMPGLAFANAVQNSSHALILLALMWLSIGGLLGFGIGRTILKVSTASLVMGAIGSVLVGLLGGSLLGVIATAIVCAGLYVLLVIVLRVDEVRLFGALARERLRRA
ncbi:MAG: hypothetical protein LC737_04975, partial [Chloroflexi bacterium]|nr:hypothetical protein [Chloroflexota bacterium]